jgi:uncharacterized membrane protein
MNCVDRLAAALALLGTRALPPRSARDAGGQVRVVSLQYSYGGMVDAALNQIRQAAGGSVAVTIRLLEAIESVARGDVPAPLREALRQQAEAIREGAGAFAAQSDRAAYRVRLQAALDALAAQPGSSAER